MANHTPGPWKFTASSPEEGFECFWIEADDEFRSSIGDVHGPQNNEGYANATLIAAAPDLLEACLAADWNSLDIPEFVREKLTAAIAKATGS